MGGIERCMCAFIGLPNSREYKVTDVKMLRPPHPAQCQPGTRCQAVFPDDGLWYDCVIMEQTEKGYKIGFTEYGSKAAGKVESKKRQIKEISTPAGYKIPESMVIAKTDTEEVIDAKKRKIQAIKKQQRVDKVEEEHNRKQNSWLRFHQNKASTRSRCGFMSGKPKESIFRVPETLEGKVGVMGSGKEMTSFAEPKKFTYQYV